MIAGSDLSPIAAGALNMGHEPFVAASSAGREPPGEMLGLEVEVIR